MQEKGSEELSGTERSEDVVWRNGQWREGRCEDIEIEVEDFEEEG